MACFPYYNNIAAVCIVYLFANYVSLVVADSHSCLAVKSEYLRQGFDDEVPDHPISGDHLKFCGGAGGSDDSSSSLVTCCTPVMEHKLSVQSRQDFDNKLKKLLNPFANLLDKKHKKFDELFTNLLNFSQRNFDKMFEKTYGVMYLQNSYIFTDLFQTFDDYYKKGEKNMQTEMDAFFKKLYQKIFTVYNTQYVFSEDYLKCVDSHMEGLKPFGDDPEKLTTNIKRSFIAFRSFVQGLATAASVVRNVLKVNPGVSCLHELMKMSHCSTCGGYQGVKPCLPYCLHVQELCLAHQLPLADMWAEFVDAMQKLGDRLEGPFNIGHEVPPINLKISNAIMNFQESGLEISNKVFQGCGQPHLGRVVRSAQRGGGGGGGGELNLEHVDFSVGRGGGGSDDDVLREHSEAISKLIREIKTKVKNSRSFWSELPSEMCKEARHYEESNCWTGKGLGRYEGSSLLNLSRSAHSSKMDEQTFRLKLITSKLQEAYHGKDVSWMDEDWLGGSRRKAEQQDDEGYEGSGSGWEHSPTHPPKGSAQYPPDDEDGYEEEDGSGQDGGEGEREGSGDMEKVQTVTDYPHWKYYPPNNAYDPVSPKETPHEGAKTPHKELNPSAAPKEKSMSLTWAVAVYLLPAVFTFLGTIG